MNFSETVQAVTALGTLLVASLALFRSFRNDGRTWIEKLFLEAKSASDKVHTSLESDRAQLPSTLDKFLTKREFERHETVQREDLADFKAGQNRMLEKIDELKDIMIGRHQP